MKIKLIVNRVSAIMNKIQNCVLFVTVFGFLLLSVIDLFSSRRFNLSFATLSVAFAAITIYLFLENRKEKNAGKGKE
jgi:succinate-acetate transporter protein